MFGRFACILSSHACPSFLAAQAYLIRIAPRSAAFCASRKHMLYLRGYESAAQCNSCCCRVKLDFLLCRREETAQKLLAVPRFKFFWLTWIANLERTQICQFSCSSRPTRNSHLSAIARVQLRQLSRLCSFHIAGWPDTTPTDRTPRSSVPS
jgi:hypothetical protein